LRPLEREDLRTLYENLWDAEGRRLTGTQETFTMARLENFFERVSLDSARIDLLICSQEDGRVIGDIAMMEIDYRNRRAIVRLALFDRENWGKGYGTEALDLLLKHGFEVLNFHRIGLDVFAFNKRAIRAYEKLGFKKEGVVRDELFYDGTYHDSIIMGILEDEFRRTADKIE
ncbi:MAG TPA: GNAT family protein, partial [Bacillales bacterium]|nr:GNAT family protein [Bacillales bacterium]